jgi:hypothetical protein
MERRVDAGLNSNAPETTVAVGTASSATAPKPKGKKVVYSPAELSTKLTLKAERKKLQTRIDRINDLLEVL